MPLQAKHLPYRILHPPALAAPGSMAEVNAGDGVCIVCRE